MPLHVGHNSSSKRWGHTQTHSFSRRLHNAAPFLLLHNITALYDPQRVIKNYILFSNTHVIIRAYVRSLLTRHTVITFSAISSEALGKVHSEQTGVTSACKINLHPAGKTGL